MSSSEPVARPHPEAVVLNIGGGFGALAVHWTAEELDTPIEVSLTGQDEAREHQHVLARPLPEQTLYAAVFDRLAVGEYTLWVGGEARERDVVIGDGAVTELHWEVQSSSS